MRTRPRERTGGWCAAISSRRSARQTARADIIYWDPFSPRANPGLWTVAAFSEARRVAGPRCTLYTYSASTATRLALLLAGWAVGVGDAIGDKRQTTAAAIAVGDLARPLDRSWLARLSRPDVPLPPDAPPDAIARARLAPPVRLSSATRIDRSSRPIEDSSPRESLDRDEHGGRSGNRDDDRVT